jgi:capsular exopolysaccharide synthesis family protein
MSRIHEALKKAESEGFALDPLDAVEPRSTRKASPESESHSALPIDLSFGEPGVMLPSTSTHDFGRLDDLRPDCAHPLWHFDPTADAFNGHKNRAHCAERFRTLRSRLYQLRNNQPLRKLLVTSAVSGEGKTFVVGNLAQAIVRQPSRSVLIIDADLRRSGLHSLLGAPAAPGLTEYLRGEADERAILQFGQIEQKGTLCLIPGGKKVTNPSELLSTGRFKTLVDRLASIFDWIIVDSPPLLAVTDASVLAECCDGLLMVVKAGSTSSALVAKAQKDARDRNIVGIVLNAVSDESRTYSSYYGISNQDDAPPAEGHLFKT